MKSTLGSINTSRNLLQDGNGVSENSRAERAISTRTRKHQGPNLLPLLIICISHSQGYPPFSHAARQHRPPSCPTPTSLFPLYRLACSASQTCSWKRLPLTCLSASKRRQALVSANSKFPRTESNWPSLGQVSTLIKFSVTGRGSWEKEDRLGPALWNGEPFPGEGRWCEWVGKASLRLAQTPSQRCFRIWKIFFFLELSGVCFYWSIVYL